MVELNPHQIKAMHALSNGKVLRADVGSGKSRIAIAYALLSVGGRFRINGRGEDRKPTSPRPLYIITTAKKRDTLEWEHELAQFAMMTGENGGWWDAPIVVDSWNNIKKYAKVYGGLFIFDEQKLVGSGAWVKAFYQIARKNQWVLLSATPGDGWQDYIPLFVANGWYRSKAEFLRTHAVYNTYASYPKIDRWVDTVKLSEFKDRVLVEVDFARHTKRHMVTKVVEYDHDLFNTVRTLRWHPFENRPIQDAGELFRLMRRVANQDQSRLDTVRDLSESNPRLIIFYNFDYELEMLRGLAKSMNVTHAEWNGHRHMPVPTSNKWLYLVQYTAGSEGWNCTSTDTVLFFSLTYSYKAFEQAMGRIDRMNTPYSDLYYFVLRGTSEIDQAIWRAIVRKKSFNERKYLKKVGGWEPDPVEGLSEALEGPLEGLEGS